MTERRTLLALLGVVGLAHLLLPFNTGLYLDDYMLIDQLKSRDWQRLYEVGDAMGNLGHAFLQWPFAAFPEPSAAIKVAVFASLLLTAVFVYRTALESALVDRFGAFFVAATDRLCVAYVCDALRNLGADLQPGQRFRTESLAHRCGIVPRQERHLDRQLSALAEDGILAQRGPQGALESLGVAPHLPLGHDAFLVGMHELDRIFDGDDMIGSRPVDQVDHAGERRGLARSGRPNHHDAREAAHRSAP